VRTTIERYNESRRRRGEREYLIVGWEETRGTARRPQGQINELIASCEFMLVLFKKSWGSDPGSPFGYTSGTEEELFTGLLELGVAERPMEDIWLGFVDADCPAPEVTALRAQLNERHALLYETFSGDLEIDRKLSDRLDSWQNNAGDKTPRHIELLPQSGRDILGAAKLRHEGEAFIRLGRSDLGLEKLEAAASLGGPVEKIALAQALGRRGRLEEARGHVASAIDTILGSSIELNSTLAGDAFLAEAGILRREGSDVDAINRLGTILGELDSRAGGAWLTYARILDERGLALQRLDRLVEATADFTAAHRLRVEHGRPLDVAQSLVNLLRSKVRERDLEAADSFATSLLELLHGTPPSELHANAWTAVGQLRLRQGRAEEGIPLVRQALSLNEQTGSTSGVARSLQILTQCHRAIGDFEAARAYALRCVEVNESMGNNWGVEQARWQLSQIPT